MVSRFIPFGQDQICFCGASACRGKLGRKPSKQKISSSVALQIVRREVFGARPVKRARVCGLQVDSGYKRIDQFFSQKKLKFHGGNQCGALVPLVPQEEHSLLTTSCVGVRVRIWWPLDDRFYSGKIVAFNSKDCTHKLDAIQIQYDDGECEVLDMENERWELEKPILPLHKRPFDISMDPSTSEESYSPASSVDYIARQLQLVSNRTFCES